MSGSTPARWLDSNYTFVRYWEYHVLRRYAETEGRSEVSPGRRHHRGESRPASTTGYENRIREFAAEHGIPISRGKVQRLALKLAKRDGATNHDAIDFWRVFGFADPTPSEAIHNLEHPRPGPGQGSGSFRTPAEEGNHAAH